MPNTFAYLALLAWPLVTLVLFRKLPRERALIWAILGGYLLLPQLVAFDFPLIPPLDKTAIASLSAYLACVLVLGVRVPLLPENGLARVLVLILFASPMASALTNGDPMIFAQSFVPGVGFHEGLSSMIGRFLELLPFFLARQLLATELALREILLALVVAGLAYSIPMLVEIRLSPMLNIWIYGYFQHDFIQMVRSGGFRPIVFLPHGLWVAFFAFMAIVAAAAMWKLESGSQRTRYLIACGYLMVVLVLCKSMAALLYALVVVPVICVAGLRWQLRLAAFLAVIAVVYPLLRGLQIVPVNEIARQFDAVSVERADSLRFRLRNEEELLTHAAARPLFGWGPSGRNYVYDPVTGRPLSTVDGLWVTVIGSAGWVGYVGYYGSLALPLVLLSRAARRHRVSRYAAPVALILAFNLADTLPNATLIAFSWLICGALLGYVEALARGRATAGAPVVADPGQPRPVRTIL